MPAILNVSARAASAMLTAALLMSFLPVQGTGTTDMNAAIRSIAQALVPRFSSGTHKGSHGRVAVLGGSLEYTGAPYYAAISSLKAGADLGYVICTKAAAIPIKSYSPELIVLPLLPSSQDAEFGFVQAAVAASSGDSSSARSATSTSTSALIAAAEQVESALSRVHSVVIGPGLGRDPVTLQFIALLLERWSRPRSHSSTNSSSTAGSSSGAGGMTDVPIVCDGDCLHLLSTDASARSSLLATPGRFILTPNAAEYSRLATACASPPHGSLPPHTHVTALSQALGGLAILQKGAQDAICAGGSVTVRTSGAIGSQRRCGGQGDILAGLVGAYAAWARSTGVWAASAAAPITGVTEPFGTSVHYWRGHGDASQSHSHATPPTPTPTPTRAQLLAACAYGASVHTRSAAGRAWAQHRRSTTTPDIILHLGGAVEEGTVGTGTADTSLEGGMDAIPTTA